MSLVTRLTRPIGEEERIPAHQFMAAAAEAKRGAPGVDHASISAAFAIAEGQDQADLLLLLRNFFGDVITREQIHDVLLLGEYGIYNEQQVIDRLLTLSTSNLLPLLVQRQIQVLGRSANDYVLAGAGVSAQAQPDMTLAVGKGAVVSSGALRAVTAGNVTIGAAHATFPRFDLVVVDASGAKVVRAGTPSAMPQVAALSNGDVCLAYVYVRPADTAINPDEILDGRIVAANGPATVGKLTTPVVFNATNAQQTYVSLTIPSGLFSAGRILRVTARGNMLLGNGTPNVTMRISYGGSTMFQDVTANATADTDRLAWTLEFDIVAQAINDQSLNGTMTFSPVGAKTAPNTGFGDIGVTGLSGVFSGASAVDSDAADRIVLVQFTMSVANALNEIVMETAYGELV